MSDSSPETSGSLDSFYNQLQDTVIEQARRLINHNRYTKAILSTLPIALLATDRSGRICSSNRAAEALLALKEKASLSECFQQDPLLLEKVERCLDNGEKFTLDSHTLVTASGEQNVVNLYLQPLYDDEDELCGMLVALEDQTYISFLKDSVQRYASPLIQSPVVAESKSTKQLVAKITELAQDDAVTLLCGDPGTGKTFIAGKLHEAAGYDSTAPFIVIDCRSLLAKDSRQFLFGAISTDGGSRDEIHFRSVHNYGAIHLANRGSMVLRHVEALPLEVQEALLQCLEHKEGGFFANLKVRFTLTTSTDLKQLATDGKFSGRLAELLQHRMLNLPTLWKRRKDILPLARLFLEESEHGTGKRFSQAAENLLISRHYSHNNVSELKEAVNLASLVSNGDEILPEYIFTGPKEEEASFEFELSRIPLIKWAYQNKMLGQLRLTMLVFFWWQHWRDCCFNSRSPAIS